MHGQHFRVFVASGTYAAFGRLLRGVQAAAALEPMDLFVQRGSGAEDFRELPGEDFISREQFAARLAWADVVVCHGGAGTIFEAHLAGHTPIIVPRLARFHEIINDHQLELAEVLSQSGLATLCEDVGELPTLIRQARPKFAKRAIGNNRLVDAVHDALMVCQGAQPRKRLRAVLFGMRKSLTTALNWWRPRRAQSERMHAASLQK
jgi:UDP-N-acetylglucosamine transferase subunit ALG13